MFGKTYGVEDARKMGFIASIVEPELLLEAALAEARLIPEECWDAYAISKKTLLAPALEAIASRGPELDRETIAVLISPASQAAHQRTLAKLKKSASKT